MAMTVTRGHVLLPAVGLLSVPPGQVVPVVGADDHGKNIVETEWGVHVAASIGRSAESQGRASVQEAVDALLRATQRLVGNAKLLGIPEVYASLIPNLHVNVQIRKRRSATSDDPILRLPTEVGEVAVEDVVIGDAVGRWEPAEVIPHGLAEAASGEIAVRQLQLRQPIHQRPDGLIRKGDVDEPCAEVGLHRGSRHRNRQVAMPWAPSSLRTPLDATAYRTAEGQGVEAGCALPAGSGSK